MKDGTPWERGVSNSSKKYYNCPLLHAGRLILEPRLIRRDLHGLRGTELRLEALERLEAHPRELVVVPDRHEGPPRTRVLDVRVVEIGAIEGSLVVERRRNVERVRDLLAVLVADDVAKTAVVAVTVRGRPRRQHPRGRPGGAIVNEAGVDAGPSARSRTGLDKLSRRFSTARG